MARTFTAPQLQLIQGGRTKARLLLKFVLDSGTYYFCDDVYDLSDGTNLYVGASALIAATDIKGGVGFGSEPVTLTIDGDRLSQSGFVDPAGLFRNIMSELFHQRRVYMSIGLMSPESQTITLIVPVYTGLINNCKVISPSFDMISGSANGDITGAMQASQGQLIITLDSLSSRYNNATYRTRSHNDQIDFAPTDMFYSFVNKIVGNERILYWGKNAPSAIASQGNQYTGSGLLGQIAAKLGITPSITIPNLPKVW